VETFVFYVSCRQNFASDWHFAGGNHVRDYPTTSVQRYVDLDMSVLAERADGRHVLILVHGYRNPLQNVLPAYAGLVRGLRAHGLLTDRGDAPRVQYGLVVGFLWPGFRTRAIGFLAARPSANRSADFLRSLIQTLRRSARTIDIQTHSLGARVALQALATQDSLWVDNLMLTAPAVDNEVLQPGEEFNESLDSCGRVFVYHSDRDPVLKTYALAGLDRALGARGPQDKRIILAECPSVHVIDCRARVSSHGQYRKVGRYFDHWARVLDRELLPRYATL
jgi:esterase/lipase superfamily enzyme